MIQRNEENSRPVGIERDRFRGCILGLALGDAIGAPNEGGIAERLLWRMLGRTRTGQCRWTDDTQMTLDVIDTLIEDGQIDQDQLATRFANGYRWSRGYGPAAAKVLKQIRRGEDWRSVNRSVYRDGSLGNGGAMRIPALGLFYATRLNELEDAVQAATEITHCHPLAIKGAMLIGVSTSLMATDASLEDVLEHSRAIGASTTFEKKIAMASSWLRADELVDARRVRVELGNGITASESCVTAWYLSLRFRDLQFEQLLDFVSRVRGDTDTIGAMAGALWGARNGVGQIPNSRVEQVERTDLLIQRADELHQCSIGRITPT